MRYFYIISCLLLISSLTGCISNYRLAIIREAREFALEEHPKLSDRDIHIIKFTTPRLEDSLLYSRDGNGNSKQDITQTVVIWELPDQDKTLMVVGFGERELHNWSPNRAILKRFRVMEVDKKKKARPAKAEGKK